MRVHVITTLHNDGYELFGKQNINTWNDFFPAEWSITYYAEGHSPIFPRRIKVVDFLQKCSKWTNFHNEVKKQARGLEGRELNRYKKALRWSFKMFALLDALKNKNERFVLWLDSDVRAMSTISEDWLTKLNKKCIACKLEKLKVGDHIETGAILIDTDHIDTDKVTSWIKEGYEEFKILDINKPWDGIWMASLLTAGNVAWSNVDLIGKSNSRNHWLIHDVGKNKFTNSSFNAQSGRKIDTELI